MTPWLGAQDRRLPEQRQVQEGTIYCSCHTGVHVALIGHPPDQESCSKLAISGVTLPFRSS